MIYGTAGAIGRAVARAFAHEGADLFLAGRTRARSSRSHQGEVEAVAEEISAAGGVAEAAVVDALEEDAIEKHLDDVVARAQRIASCSTRYAVGMDDVQGTLLVAMSAEASRSRSSRLRGPSSSPRARRRGGWSGKAPG